MPHRELAFYLEAHDEEKYGEQRIVDPMQQRHAERRVTEAEREGSLPEMHERGSERRVREPNGQQCREQQQEASRRRPARESERGNAHAMSERTQHRVG